MPNDYEFHPVCLAFPAYEPGVYDRRRDDYKAHPERAGDTAVVVAQDEADGEWKIADGRHHYLICRELGYEFDVQRFTGGRNELVDLVESRNANRRHQTQTQVAASILALNAFRHGGDRRSPGYQAATLPLDTQAEVAERRGVSERTVRNANKAAKADPDLLPAMRDGKIDAFTAAKVADLPAAERKAVIDAPDVKAAAKAATAKPKPKRPDPVSAESEPAPPAGKPHTYEVPLDVLLDWIAQAERHLRQAQDLIGKLCESSRGDDCRSFLAAKAIFWERDTDGDRPAAHAYGMKMMTTSYDCQSLVDLRTAFGHLKAWLPRIDPTTVVAPWEAAPADPEGGAA